MGYLFVNHILFALTIATVTLFVQALIPLKWISSFSNVIFYEIGLGFLAVTAICWAIFTGVRFTKKGAQMTVRCSIIFTGIGTVSLVVATTLFGTYYFFGKAAEHFSVVRNMIIIILVSNGFLGLVSILPMVMMPRSQIHSDAFRR